MNLKQLVKEALANKDCCKATKPTKAPILNESLAPREILSEGLKYHIDNKKPLTETGYRDWETDRKSTRLNSSHSAKSRMPSSA